MYNSIKSILVILFISVLSQPSSAQTVNPKLDTALAKKLDADDYGMKMYVFVLLKTGGNVSKDKTYVENCFRGHLENIGRLAEANQLVVAGPFGKNDADLRGLFILNVRTVEEGRKLLETDPAIKADLLKAELYPWYGSAAISEYLPAHDKIWKSKP